MEDMHVHGSILDQGPRRSVEEEELVKITDMSAFKEKQALETLYLYLVNITNSVNRNRVTTNMSSFNMFNAKTFLKMWVDVKDHVLRDLTPPGTEIPEDL